jgi:hypothetical protein
MHSALKSGRDPNELDTAFASRPERSIGRPLHYATEYTVFDTSRRWENLPVVELLMRYGADPRMEGMGGNKSPLEEVRGVVKANSPDSELKWASERDMEFFKGALEVMEGRARELDGELFLHLSCISFIDSWCFGTQKSWCLALYWYKGQR